MSVKINLSDLLSLANNNQLNEIAFTMPQKLTGKENLKGFNRIRTISMELVKIDSSILMDLFDNFESCQNLELFSETRLILDLNFDNLENKFADLISFIGSGKVYFHIVTESKDILTQLLEDRQLKEFHFNIYLKFSSPDKVERVLKQTSFKEFEYNLTNDSFDLRRINRVDNQCEIDNFVTELCTESFLSNLVSFKLKRALDCECMLNTIETFKLGTSLKTLDLKAIHIHSTDSICQTLANLKSNFTK